MGRNRGACRPGRSQASRRRHPPGGLVNVNFPACSANEVKGIAFTRQGRRNVELMRVEERRDGRGLPYYWLMFQRGG